MAPLKFEDSLKEKLEDRLIQPSANAWDNLADRLEIETKKSKKTVYWRIGIAASIIGVLWFSYSGFNNNTIKPLEPQITDTKTIESIEKTIPNDIIIDKFTTEPTSDPVSIITKTIINTSKKQGLISNTNSEKEQRILNKYKQILKTETTEIASIEEITLKKEEITPEIKSIEAQKIDEVVTQIMAFKKQNTPLTSDEVDILLAQAQKEIQLHKIHTLNSQTIDATALLQDVEDALNRSFREKVFDELKINYNNIRTAVAQINN